MPDELLIPTPHVSWPMRLARRAYVVPLFCMCVEAGWPGISLFALPALGFAAHQIDRDDADERNYLVLLFNIFITLTYFAFVEEWSRWPVLVAGLFAVTVFVAQARRNARSGG